MVSASGDNVSGLSGDQGAVGVGDKAGEASGIDGWASDGGDWQTLGGQVLSAGSDNSGLVSGDDGAVGVGHKAERPLGAGDSHGGGEDSLKSKGNHQLLIFI